MYSGPSVAGSVATDVHWRQLCNPSSSLCIDFLLLLLLFVFSLADCQLDFGLAIFIDMLMGNKVDGDDDEDERLRYFYA